MLWRLAVVLSVPVSPARGRPRERACSAQPAWRQRGGSRQSPARPVLASGLFTSRRPRPRVVLAGDTPPGFAASCALSPGGGETPSLSRLFLSPFLRPPPASPRHCPRALPPSAVAAGASPPACGSRGQTFSPERTMRMARRCCVLGVLEIDSERIDVTCHALRSDCPGRVGQHVRGPTERPALEAWSLEA